MKSLLLLIVAILFPPPSWAQDASNATPPPLPPGPLLGRAPSFSRWTVVSQLGGSSQGQASAPSGSQAQSGSSEDKKKPAKQVLVVKTSPVIYEQTIDSSGRKTEVWHINGLQLIVQSPGADPLVYPDFSASDIYTTNYATTDFAGLDWISDKTYVGTQKAKGRDCLVFRSEVSSWSLAERREAEHQRSRSALAARANPKTAGVSESNDNGPASGDGKVSCRAFIDLETRLPLVASFGNEIRYYEFAAPPAAMLSLPPSLKTAANNFLRRTQDLAKLPPQP